MSTIDRIVTWNSDRPGRDDPVLPPTPALRLAVVTCMDARLDVLGVLGLQPGDAHVLRNAGGIITEDVLRSLVISQRELGTREIAIFHHTQCGLQGFDDGALRDTLAAETGARPTWHADGFADPAAQARASVATVRDCPWLPHREHVRGFVWDVVSDELTEAS